MKKEDVVTLTIHNAFSWRDRLRILFGFQIQNHVSVKVEAEVVGEEIKLTATPSDMQTRIGRVVKK